MATKKYFDVITSGKYYSKFINDNYILKADKLHPNNKNNHIFFIHLNDKGGEVAYTTQECKTYHDVENACKAFLEWCKSRKKFDI